MNIRNMNAAIGTVLFGLCLANSAHADSATASFSDHLDSGGPAVGMTASFSLNGNGTIAATVQSFAGNLEGIGISSGSGYGTHYQSSNFSTGSPTDTSWGTAYGSFGSGWYNFQSSAATESWTIGTAGQFSSVMQLFGANSSGYEMFAFTGNDQWATQSVVAAVPEPGTYALLLCGLGCVGFMSRRRA